MNVCSIQFLGFCLLVVIAFQSIARRGGRRLFLTIANLAFLIPFVPNWRSGAAFVLGVVGSYLLVRAAGSRPSRTLVPATIVLAVGLFLILKRYTFLGGLLPGNLFDHQIELIGLSYMLFKFIHVLVDQSQGQLAPLSFACYANYQLAFFTLLAGPIQRYNDFHSSWEMMDAEPAGADETLLAWNRIFPGLFKMGLLAPIFGGAFEAANQAGWSAGDDTVMRRFFTAFYAYPFFLYFNFSGYTDVAIGSARLLGFRLPENFNHPFLARNVIDYWNRWHISLSHWMRDYVFMTSYKKAAETLPRAGKITGPFLLFLTLLLSGAWHGSLPRYAIFGALHGLGAAANHVYGDVLKSRLGRSRFQRYQKSPLVHWLAIILTFHFTCVGFLIFSSGLSDALMMLRAVRFHMTSRGPGAFTTSDPALVGVLASLPVLLWALWKRDAVLGFLDRISSRLTRRTGSLYRLVAAETALMVFLLLCLWALEQKDTVVVYMRF